MKDDIECSHPNTDIDLDSGAVLPEGITITLGRQALERLLDHPENFRDEIKDRLKGDTFERTAASAA